MKVEKRIQELGLEIPASSPAGGSYTPVTQEGNILFVAGQIPIRNGEFVFTGKAGTERDFDYACDAAKLCIINLVAALKAYLGDLDKVKRVLKLQVFVNSEVGFLKQHLVANAASELLCQIFGENGQHARTAIGTNQLPMDVTVEIEAIVAING